MTESFLEEQLERIRKLTERISQVENRKAELSEELARDRAAAPHNPLSEVRDYRVIGQAHDDEADGDEPARPRSHSARDSNTRRRRQR